MSIQSVNPFSNFNTNLGITKPTSIENQNQMQGFDISQDTAIKYLKSDMTCKINNQKVSDEANKIAKKTAAALQEMLKKQDELTQLYKSRSSIAPDGKTTIQITAKQNVGIMKGYSKDNKELFSAMFIDGKLSSYKEGIDTTEKSEKYAKRAQFSDGKILFYKEDCEELQDGTETFKTAINFYQNKPLIYEENGAKEKNGNLKCEKYALFSGGKPDSIYYGYDLENNTAQKSYKLVSNNWVEFKIA